MDIDKILRSAPIPVVLMTAAVISALLTVGLIWLFEIPV